MHRPLVAKLTYMAVGAACAWALLGQAAVADVTIQEQSTFELSFIKAHDTSSQLISGDKERRDSEIHCDGLMSLLCRNLGGGTITRLDKDLIWTLNPKDKEYTETHFPTTAEREAAEEKLRAALEKLKQCPARKDSGTPDTSKCQMSPPKIDAGQTDQHQTIIGHDARLSQVRLTESCHTPDSTDTCDFIVALDVWLTQDEIPGMADRKAFNEAYAKKLGLSDPNGSLQKMLQQFLAPYRDALKDVAAKAKDFKGYPLKTTIRIMFGGAQCAAAKNSAGSGAAGGGTVADASTAAGQAAASSSAGEAQSAAGQAAQNAAGNGVAGRIFGSAAGAFTNKLASGLFGKKSSGTPAAAPATDVPPNMVQFATITIETTSITASAIPAEQFEVPAGWKLITPKAKAEDKEFTCPRT